MIIFSYFFIKIEKIALECESMVKPLVKWSTINSHACKNKNEFYFLKKIIFLLFLKNKDARVCEVLKEAGFLKGDLKSVILFFVIIVLKL